LPAAGFGLKNDTAIRAPELWNRCFQLFQTLMPNYLLFQAYTPQQVAQCRYFLLKYLSIYNLKPPSDTAIFVYTNDPVSFEGFLNFVPQFQMPNAASASTLTRTGVLHEFLQHHSGAVLFCDTATYPLQPLEHLFADICKGALYLHSPRSIAETELTRALRRFTSPRDKTAITIAAPPPTKINVWQAAVVGLHSQQKELIATLQERPDLNDATLDYNYTKVFQERGKIKSAAKYIYTYSNLPEFSQLLEAFFRKNDEESIPNQVKLVHHIDAAAILQQKEAYSRQPLFKKWLQLISGKRWTIRQYENRF
jgi:hypothetical protein